MDRRIDYVVLNRSLDPETNGEDWLIRQLPPGPTVIDVGFHQGGFSRRVLKHRPQARILAFDPSLGARRAWKTHFGKSSPVRFLPVALADREGIGNFHDSGDECASLVRRSPGARSSRVRICRLDRIPEVKETPVDLLKIDAEGFDLNVMEGAARLMRKNWFRIILFEYADGWAANRRLLAEADVFLKNQGYGLFRLFPEFLVPFRYQAAEERFDLGCMFVALPRAPQPGMRLPVSTDPFV